MKYLVYVAALLSPLWAGGLALAQQDPGPDIIAVFDPAVSMGDLTIGSQSTELDVKPGSSVLINTNDASCTGAGCQAELVYLRVTFDQFEMDIVNGGDVIGHLVFDNATAIIGGPVTMQNAGFGFIIPGGTRTSFTADLSGNIRGTAINAPAGSEGVTAGPILLSYTVQPFQALTINGTIPFVLSSTGSIDGDPVEFTLPGELALSGASGTVNTPFRNSPPTARAVVPASVSCGQAISLDGRTSSDPDGSADLTSFRWFADGVEVAQGSLASTTLASGTHSIVLQVSDKRGASDTDTKQVVVAGETAPVFTFVPPDITAAACGAVSLGQTTANSACGTNVQVTNNAPSFFPAGVTVVTWTATGSTGLTTTVTQRVTAPLNDNPACCPAGSNKIFGTPNNDNLIGTAGPDCILGGGGQDTIDGRGGNDIIGGGEGDDRLTGGDGDDLIEAGNGQDQLFGSAGNDSLLGGGGDDRIEGNEGNDQLSGGPGQDQLFGGNGNDSLRGDAGDDRLDGGAGDDFLDGGADHNQCTGGPGIDQVLACTQLDSSDQAPPNEGTNVCLCRPNKCTDCASQAQSCTAASGCASILQCVRNTPNCNLPHECSATCENGQSSAAIAAARNLGSCLGGCE